MQSRDQFKKVASKKGLFYKLNLHSDNVNWYKVEDSLISVDWLSEFQNLVADQILDRFLFICIETAQGNVRLKVKGSKKNTIPVERRRLMSRRKHVNKQLNRPKSKLSKGLWKKLLWKLVDIEKLLMKSYHKTTEYEENKAVQALQNNHKYFYSFAKRKPKLNSQVELLLDHTSNEFVTDDTRVANILAD